MLQLLLIIKVAFNISTYFGEIYRVFTQNAVVFFKYLLIRKIFYA